MWQEEVTADRIYKLGEKRPRLAEIRETEAENLMSSRVANLELLDKNLSKKRVSSTSLLRPCTFSSGLLPKDLEDAPPVQMSEGEDCNAFKSVKDYRHSSPTREEKNGELSPVLKKKTVENIDLSNFSSLAQSERDAACPYPMIRRYGVEESLIKNVSDSWVREKFSKEAGAKVFRSATKGSPTTRIEAALSKFSPRQRFRAKEVYSSKRVTAKEGSSPLSKRATDHKENFKGNCTFN